MSDILLITYHNSLSYGVCLQTAATVRILQSAGHMVRVIDYENVFEARQRNGKLIHYGTLKELAVSFVKRILFKNEKYKKRAFGHAEKYYLMTCEHYTSAKQMNNLQTDILIVGSDQVWNPKISRGLDSAFFLGFGKAKKRISFASSMGSHCFTQREKEYVKKALDRFSAISVREKHAEEQIQLLVEKPVHVLLDPTLLVSAEQWRRFSKEIYGEKIPDKSYILVFVIGKHVEKTIPVFKYYSQKLKLPVWRIMLNSFRGRSIDRVIAGPTPEEFIWLIDHAAMVITDSFHGAAFSINLETPFVLFPVQGNNIRMEELLEMTDLKSRMYFPGYYPNPECDFNSARERLELKRKTDQDWIKLHIK